MTTHAISLDGLVIRSRHHEGEQLLHCCLASSVRAIDVKEGSWNATMVGVEHSVSAIVSVYGEGTSTYDDGNGRRVVIIAGEVVDEDDKASYVLEIARNEFLFSASALAEVPTSPFWLTSREGAGALHRQAIRLRSNIRRLADTCDYQADLKFQQWFSDMHDKMMPIPGYSYSEIWKSNLAVAESINLHSGVWLPAQFQNTKCVLHVESTCGDVMEATAYYVTPNNSSPTKGCRISRVVNWDDTSKTVEIGEVIETMAFAG